MPHQCEGCSKIFSERRHLHRHENKCSKLKEQSERQWKLMREAEKDPEERKRRRLFQEELPHNPRNPFERFKNLPSSRKKVKTSSSNLEDTPLRDSEGPSNSGLRAFGADDDCLASESLMPEPIEFGNISPSPLTESLPSTRVGRLTERAKAMLEDELPEGAGDLLPDESVEEPTSDYK